MWYSECGKDGDVVLSSRVRLARNIDKIPFPARANENQQDEILNAYDVWADITDKYLEAEREAIGDITENIDYLGIKGAMLKVDGEIIAFTFAA